MGLPCQVKHKPHHLAQQKMRKACVSASAPTRCHRTPQDPAVPCSQDAPAKKPRCREGDFLGTAGCKGHCCPLLVQGQGEPGQPCSHPGPGTPAGGDPAVPCCHMRTECTRAQPGCHCLRKLVLLDPPCRLRAFLVPGPCPLSREAFSYRHCHGLSLQRHSAELGDRSHAGNKSNLYPQGIATYLLCRRAPRTTLPPTPISIHPPGSSSPSQQVTLSSILCSKLNIFPSHKQINRRSSEAGDQKAKSAAC